MSRKKGHSLALAVYAATQRFPADERFGLTQQIRRAAVSIGSNIAEGAGRDSDADFARFLQIAAGSTSEVEYQSLLARDLGYMDPATYEQLKIGAQEVRKMLYAFVQRLR
ncbi:MAG: four helix bundle protein [Dehalococcoidia bacterium]